MRMFFSLLLPLAMGASVLAQPGRVSLINDSLHLVFWDPNCDDIAYFLPAGHAYMFNATGWPTLRIELWAGTTSNSLSNVANTTFVGQTTPGTWPGTHVTLPFPGNVAAYFQINIYDQQAGSWLQAIDGGYPHGQTPMFTAIPGTFIYNSLAQHTYPAYSTWPDGTYPLDIDVGPGARGSVMLTQFLEGQLPPTLSIQPAGPGQLTIDWTFPFGFYSTFYLQVNDTLNVGGWTNAPSGNNHPVTVPVTNSAIFYRLIQHCP